MPGRFSKLELIEALDRLSTDMPERDIIQQGVDLAQSVTDSRIAYLHFLNEDQNTLELGVWSKDTVGYCKAVYDRHYPIEAAGIWADSAPSVWTPCSTGAHQRRSLQWWRTPTRCWMQPTWCSLTR